MLLPKDIISGVYVKPQIFLCEADKTRICQLDTYNTKGSFKFNSYSELSFDVARVYNDIITGEIKVNPFYDKIEAVRLVELNGFGFFELQDPEIVGDGIKEVKSLAANSLEYTLSQKYLEDFYINTGKVDSVEVIYAEQTMAKSIIPVTLYNQNCPELSLLHLILEKVYGWSIGHVDESLKNISRQFEVQRESVYDFIMNEICDKFNCYAIFDTVNNTINFYAEALSNKFTGDGSTKTFTVSPIFSEISTVTVDGYKTIDYEYNLSTGELTLGTTPTRGAMIEITDGSAKDWETDVFVTFDNLAQEMNISYSADNIKTVLTAKGAENLDIREVNSGLPYLVDLSYFHTVEWMGEDLYAAYQEYQAKCTTERENYKKNATEIIKISNKILYEQNKLTLSYTAEDEDAITSETVGTYYVKGDDDYYTEVSLPAEYVAGTRYYSVATTSINQNKVSTFYEALKTYYSTGEVTGFDSDLENAFSFISSENSISNVKNTLLSDSADTAKDAKVKAFLTEAWDQLGLTPLKTLYYEPYKKIQTVNINAGWAVKGDENYGLYYPVILILESLNAAIEIREKTIAGLMSELTYYNNENAKIADSLLISNPNNFTEDQLVRLNAFLREDEYVDDNFVITDNHTTNQIIQIKQELLECGRIELSKLCHPCFKFSMSLANIYALPEFAPIATQFQLGKLIKVALRKDYIRHARLMRVDINFEDFSDFSCEFGDLSSVKSQTDLHADLLSQAVSAGKTVAGSASYWEKGADIANSIDTRVQQGLLNAATEIKSIDGTQQVTIDKYGIHLQEIVNPSTGELDPKQGWIVNNKFLYSDDGFRTVKSVFGEYTIDDETYWGLLAEAVIAGYIEGSTIKGGTIQIGEREDGGYNFEVDENGYITMVGGKGVSSNGETVDLDDYNTTIDIIASGTILGSGTQSIELTCKIYSYGIDITNDGTSNFRWLRSSGDDEADEEWNSAHNNDTSSNVLKVTIADVTDTAFFQCQVSLPSGIKVSDSVAITVDGTDVNIFTSKPDSTMIDGFCYHVGDLWVLGSDYQPEGYSQNTIMVCLTNNTQYLDSDWVESAYYSKTFQDLNNRTTLLEQHVIIDPEGLHLRASSDEDITFESLLTSSELAFGTRNENGLNKIVWLGKDDMNARNVTVENYVNIKAADDTQPYMKLGNFKFQVEDNGSLSIM